MFVHMYIYVYNNGNRMMKKKKKSEKICSKCFYLVEKRENH